MRENEIERKKERERERERGRERERDKGVQAGGWHSIELVEGQEQAVQPVASVFAF